MRILIIEAIGALLDLVVELEREGHEVEWYIKRKRERDVGEGLVDAKRLDRWSPRVKEADLIIFGDSAFGQPSVSLKKQGKLVVGGSPTIDKLATDPFFLQKTAQSLRIPTKITSTEKDDGVPTFATVGAFFNGYNWIKPVFQGWRYKGFLEGGRGPRITSGVAGKWIGKSKLFNEILRPFDVLLRANNYTGYAEVSCVIEKSKALLVDLTCSLTGPSSLLMNELQREPWGNFYGRLAKGAVKHIKTMSRQAVGVRMFTLPAPAMGMTDVFKGVPIRIDGDLDHIHLAQMAKVGDLFTVAGTSGFICMPTGHAITMETAKERAYKTLESIRVSDAMYRLDIGDVPEVDNLRKWGYV